MRMRVEDLASAADVSVDTIRYYQKQRLLPPPERDGRLAWYTAEHLQRIGQVKELQRRGFTLAVIRRFLAGELDPADERLAAAVAEAEGHEGTEELFSLDELAARCSVPSAILEALVREGLLVPHRHDGELRFSRADVELVANGLRLVEAGLPMPELLDLSRRHHALTREIAAQAVELFDAHVREPLRAADLSEAERAERLVQTFRTVLPAVTAMVAHHFRRILLQVAQEHLEKVGEPTEIAAAQREGMPTEATSADAARGLEAVPSQ
ncbi:MAG TPA: MerR family transcriptional regulator [Acidimicrobiales bacterium]|nr:MerR family transcriptional regulator [Acidimicrobiales bacterium]